MTLLYVGLDHDDRAANLTLARELVDTGAAGFGFKVNLDHALLWGENYVREVVGLGRPVFVDLKMNNGPRTMSTVVRWLGGLGVAHTNAWAHAESNLARTVALLAELADRPALLAVTFYTRWDEAYAQTHHRMSLDELVGHWARTAVECGADGVICPAPRLAATAGLDTTRLCGGIRLAGERTASRQVQVATPQQAVAAGADMVAVGSPIHGAADPAAALRTYLAALAG